MARLIEVQDVRMCPSRLAIYSGDVLIFKALGGHIQSGDDVVELLGPFLPAVLGDNGNIFAPEGFPNTVMISARRSGRALIELFTGEHLHTPRRTTLDITIDSRVQIDERDVRNLLPFLLQARNSDISTSSILTLIRP